MTLGMVTCEPQASSPMPRIHRSNSSSLVRCVIIDAPRAHVSTDHLDNQ
jgi:hypothetical protein